MFDLVMTVPRPDAVNAVYEAGLRLSQRERLAWIKETGEFPVTEDALAAQLLAEIEQAEGRELVELSKEETDRYIVELSSRLSERIQKEFPDHHGRGREILEEMRAQYSWPHYGRRAS
jgi:hypothetical protein